MRTRIITAIVAIVALLPVIYFSGTVIFCIALSFISAVAVFELVRCMDLKQWYIMLPTCVIAAILPFLARYVKDIRYFCLFAFICATACFMYLFTLSILSHGKLDITRVATLFSVALYIVSALNSIVYVRDFGEYGKYIYLLIPIGACISDTFAYFTGVFFGKHKLIPEVSPKKTVEGAVGAVVFTSLSFVGFGVLLNLVFDTEANLIFLAIGGFIISVLAQIGDLMMSVIKRHYGIKDFGNIFPGHGGMLDRLDSILAVAVGVAVLCMFTSMTGITIF